MSIEKLIAEGKLKKKEVVNHCKGMKIKRMRKQFTGFWKIISFPLYYMTFGHCKLI